MIVDKVFSLFCPVNVYILKSMVCLHLQEGYRVKIRHNNATTGGTWCSRQLRGIKYVHIGIGISKYRQKSNIVHPARVLIGEIAKCAPLILINALYNLNTCYIFCVGLPASFKYMHNNGCTGILLSMLSCTLLNFFHSYFTLSVFSRKKYLLKSRPSFPKLWLGVIATLSHPCLCCCNSPQISMRFH